MLRFAGFDLDLQRAELRGPDGVAVRLRRKSFDLLYLFATNPGRVLSKDELMAAVWPNLHVGDDSLFQCVREIRSALDDESHEMLMMISGRGYRFDAKVLDTALLDVENVPAGRPDIAGPDDPVTAAGKPRAWFDRKGVLAGAIGLAIVALAIVAYFVVPLFISKGARPAVLVMPITTMSDDNSAARMSANVTGELSDGLAAIESIRVLKPGTDLTAANYVITGELYLDEGVWSVQARMTEVSTSEVKWAASSVVDTAEIPNALVQQSRLVAGLGHLLARRFNTLLRPVEVTTAQAASNVVIQQATAQINQTSPERFRAAQEMLESGLVTDPGNVDLEVALAAHMLRGVQMVWYSQADSAAAANRARSILERAIQSRPASVPVHEAYCRFLTATNQFKDSLVACAQTLTLDPWNGIALYHIGLTQLYLGRFEEALATFIRADRFNTPEVSRWTWTLGAGWACMLMNQPEKALPWLNRSIAITPASGRTYFLLSAAFYQLGRIEAARAATAEGLKRRPGSNATNVRVPIENASPVFVDAVDRLVELGVAAGLPEH